MKKSSEVFFSVFDDICDLRGEVDVIQDEDMDDCVLISSYRNTPVDGSTCTITYGLSEVSHPEWLSSRPELFMCVNSLSQEWGQALGRAVLMWRHEYLFEQGSVIHYGKPISSGSSLDCFFLYTSDLIEHEDQRVDLAGVIVNVTQAYPIFTSEISLLRRIGSSAFFWDLGVQFDDINREPAVGPN